MIVLSEKKNPKNAGQSYREKKGSSHYPNHHFVLFLFFFGYIIIQTIISGLFFVLYLVMAQLSLGTSYFFRPVSYPAAVPFGRPINYLTRSPKEQGKKLAQLLTQKWLSNYVVWTDYPQ